jgi:hypothetical protein
MTKAFGRMLGALSPEQAQCRTTMYDIRLRDYDGAGQDLLIEAKPDSNKDRCGSPLGSSTTSAASSATGQNRPRSADDRQPDQSHIDLLVSDLGITALWFEDKTCQSLNGEVKAWQLVARFSK